MCYHVQQIQSAKDLSKIYNARVTLDDFEVDKFYHTSGFSHANLSLIINKEGNNSIEKMRWGLMPNWKKPLADMVKLSNNTLNAKAETVFDLSSFKNSILKYRAVLPVDGFFEYKHTAEDKLPYFIHPVNEPVFHLGCVFAFYQNPESQEWIKSFSILTNEANELMAEIHNSKKRMPLILKADQVSPWLNSNTDKQEVENLLKFTYDDAAMASHQVNRNLLKLGNKPEVSQPI